MASACAKFSGRLGVCIVMSGRGAAPLLTELDEARLDHMPVLDQARHFATDPGGG